MRTRDSRWLRTSRRHMLGGSLTAGLGLAGMSLVGCGDDDDDTPGGDGASTTGAASPSGTAAPEQPRAGGKLRIATRPWEVSLDAHFTTRPELIYAWQAISHPLLELNAKNEITNGGVAESHEIADPQTIRFKLWPGIRFHDKAPVNGRDFTSDDVKYSLERIASEGAPRAANFKVIEAIETPDATTVVLKLAQPSVPLLYFLASSYNVMVAREVVEQFGDLKRGDAALGVGPFIVDSMSIENGASLRKNPNYFRSGLPYLDSLDLIPLKDPAVALPNAFRAGESELVWVRENELRQFESQFGDLVTARTGTIVPYGVLMNTAVKPWDDVRIRKAIHLVIDRAQVAEAMGADAYMVAPVMQPLGDYALSEDDLSTLPGYRRKKDEDIAEAKKLLRAAGFENDFKDLSLTLESSAQSNYSEQWEILVPQLQRLGIDLEMKPMEHTAFKAAENKRELTFAFDGFLADSEPDSMLTILHHSKGSRNVVNYSNPETDRLIEKQRAEFDRDARVELCREVAMKLIDDVAYAWMLNSWDNMAHRSRLRGFEGNMASRYEADFTEAWLAEA